LDPIGLSILKKINAFKLPLTDIYLNFKGRGGVGCANCFDTTPAKAASSVCTKDGRHHKTDENDGIDYRYQNKPLLRGNKEVITYQGSWEPKVTE
jgi:hypothetical protein